MCMGYIFICMESMHHDIWLRSPCQSCVASVSAGRQSTQQSVWDWIKLRLQTLPSWLYTTESFHVVFVEAETESVIHGGAAIMLCILAEADSNCYGGSDLLHGAVCHIFVWDAAQCVTQMF